MIKINLLTENPARLYKCSNPILLVLNNGTMFVTEDPEMRLLMLKNQYTEVFAKSTSRTLLVISGLEESVLNTNKVDVRIKTTAEGYVLRRMMIDWDPLESTIVFSTEIVPSPENQIIAVTKELDLQIFRKS